MSRRLRLSTFNNQYSTLESKFNWFLLHNNSVFPHGKFLIRIFFIAQFTIKTKVNDEELRPEYDNAKWWLNDNISSHGYYFFHNTKAINCLRPIVYKSRQH